MKKSIFVLILLLLTISTATAQGGLISYGSASIGALSAEATVSDAISIMKNKKVGGLPVIEDEELVGIITERDILDALVY